jgi:hypothetical protein
MPVLLKDARTGRPIGTITDEEFQVLAGALEEESEDDRDYYINVETVDMLEERGAPRQLVTLLRRALDGREDIDIAWERA